MHEGPPKNCRDNPQRLRSALLLLCSMLPNDGGAELLPKKEKKIGSKASHFPVKKAVELARLGTCMSSMSFLAIFKWKVLFHSGLRRSEWTLGLGACVH